MIARALLIVAAAALSACGPVGATSVVSDAEVAVARAHAAGGDNYAVYETTGADLYLQKAREEQGRARYSAAMELAQKSVELAGLAARRAVEAKKQPVTPPAAPANIARPPPGVEAPPPLVAPAPPSSPPAKEPIQPEDKK